MILISLKTTKHKKKFTDINILSQFNRVVLAVYLKFMKLSFYDYQHVLEVI